MRKQCISVAKREEGMVAITITMIIMIIVVLVVTSFALIVRREQRQALDRQLSAQALYAAEAGIEDAKTALSLESGALEQDVTDCTGPDSLGEIMRNNPNIAGQRNFSQTLEDNIKYTCVLIERTPLSLDFGGKSPQNGPFIAYVSAENIDRIKIGWNNQNRSTSFDHPTNFDFPNSGSLNTAMASVTVVPAFGGGALSRDDLRNWSHTFFIYPNQDVSSGNYGTISYLNGSGGVTTDARQGQILNGHCNSGSTPKFCNVEIDNLNRNAPAGTNEDYFLIVKPLYQPADFSFSALNSAGDEEPLFGAQAVVDSTGRAADVLRRVQARVPIQIGAEVNTIEGILPFGALVSEQAICKKWVLTNDSASNTCTGGLPIILNNTGGGGASGNAVIGNCSPPTDPVCQSSSGDPGSPTFRWTNTFTNDSNNNPADILNCVWDWGDGTTTTFAAGDPACAFQGRVTHNYNPPTDSRGWEALITSTNGDQGCWIFNVTLTMNFTPASGLSSKQDVYAKYLPGGQANDAPNPTTGTGICYGNDSMGNSKYKTYIP